jgi:hypothetical protein
MKLIIIIILSLFCIIRSHSQDLVNNEKNEVFNLNISDELYKFCTDSNKIYVWMYINIPNKEMDVKKNYFDCISNFNSDLFEFKINNYIGENKMIKLRITNNNDKIEQDYGRTTFFVYSKKFINKNEIKNRIPLRKFKIKDKVIEGFYEVEESNNQDEICWKLNQVIHYFEQNKNNWLSPQNRTEKTDSTKNAISVSAGVTPLLAGQFSTSESFYKHHFKVNQIPLAYHFNLKFWIENFSLGLGYNYSAFNLSNNPEDSYYQTDWNMPFFSQSQKLNIYARKVQEEIKFEVNTLSLLAGYRLKFSERLAALFDFSFNYYLPFSAKSRLTDGLFSYRGEISGIEDEFINIPEWGLNDSDISNRNSESRTNLQGIGVQLSAQLAYQLKSFNLKFGLGYQYSNFTNNAYSPDARISDFSGNYQSSLSGFQNLNSNFLTVHLGLEYIIK